MPVRSYKFSASSQNARVFVEIDKFIAVRGQGSVLHVLNKQRNYYAGLRVDNIKHFG